MTDRADPSALARRFGFRPVEGGKGGDPGNDNAPDATPVEMAAPEPEWETWWLPEPVKAWVEAVHVAFDVPRVMPIAAAMCAASVMLQGKARVRVKAGWEEPLCLFWLVFAPTAAMKSGVLTLATRPVYALQDRLQLENEPIARAAKRRRWVLEAKLKSARQKTTPEAALTPKLDVFHQNYNEERDTRRDLIQQLDDELHATPVPSAPRWLFDDLNPALVLTKMRRNLDSEGIARMAVLDAEGTFMSNLLGRHSGHVDVSSLLKGYTGERINKARASRTSDDEVDTVLPHAFLTLCLMAQPHVLDTMKAVPELADNGLMGRCIVTQINTAHRLPPPDAPPVPEDVQAGYEAWVQRLARVKADTVLDLSEHFSAKGVLLELYKKIDLDMAAGHGAVGWSKRSLGRVCRLLALSHIEPEGKSQTAIKIRYLEKMLYSGALAGARVREPQSDTIDKTLPRVLEWIRDASLKKVTLRALRRGPLRGRADAVTVCDALVESGHLEIETEIVRRNKALTVTYKVLTTDPKGVARFKPEVVPEPVPPDEIEPEPYEPEPDPSEWRDAGE